MISLLSFFCKRSLFIALVLTMLASVVIVFLDALGVSYLTVLSLLFISVYLLPLYLSFSNIPTNLSWVMSLPVSKKRIILCHAFLNIYAVILSVICVFLVSAFYYWLSDLGSTLSEFKGFSFYFDSFLNKALQPQNDLNPKKWFNLFLAVSAVLTTLIFIPPKQIQAPNRKVRQYKPKLIISLLVIGFVIFKFRYLFDTPFFIGIIFLGIEGIFIYSTLNRVGINVFERNLWLKRFIVTCSVFVIFFVSLAVYGLSSGNPSTLAHSSLFLGPLSGKYNSKDLAYILESNIKSSQIKSIGEVIQKKYFNDDKISSLDSPAINWGKAIETKKSLFELKTFVKLFNVSSLSVENIVSYLKVYDSKSPKEEDKYHLLDFIKVDLTPKNLKYLLSLNINSVNQFVFYWLRYHPSENGLNLLVATSIKKPEIINHDFFDALSVLTGRKLSYDEFIRTRNKSLSFYNINCDQYRFKKSAIFTQKNTADLNRCLRISILNNHPEQAIHMESIGWISMPFNSKEKTLVKKHF